MYIKAIAATLAVIAVIVTATVMIHESGHFTAGSLFGCSDVQITLFDEHLETYTKMNCGDIAPVKFNAIAMSGLLFVVPLSAVLFLLNRRTYAMIIFGFNLVISSSDFSYLVPQFGVYASMLIGAATVIYGESLLVNRYIKYTDDKAIPSYSPNQ